MELIASYLALYIIYSLLIISLNNFIVGKTYIWSIGHLAFFGIGAFCTGILIHDFHLSGWIALIISGTIGIVISFLIGLTTLKLKGDYFIILSIGISELVRALILQLKGPSGMTGIVRPRLFNFSLENDWIFIGSVLIPFLIIIIIIARRFSKSPIERICALIRYNEDAAKLLGVSPLYYKTGCFIIGSLIATIAGGFYTFYTKSTDPSTITIYQNILLFAMVLLGGINSLRGSLLGGLMLIIVPRILEFLINNPLASYYSAQILQLIYGLLLIITIRYLPQGLMGTSKSWLYRSEY